MENAYIKRLGQLREQKVQASEKKIQPLLSRPLSKQAPGPAQNPNPPRPEEAQPDMTSMFGRNVEMFTGEDKRFGNFMQQYTEMANGLREQVKEGFMPEPIAKQRLEQYLGDSMKYFQDHKAGVMDNPQVAGAIEGLLAQSMEGQLPEQQVQAQAQAQEQVPAQAMTPQQAPQGGMNG